jgi:1-deoxy-D-xylulose-5-phosphate synthase
MLSYIPNIVLLAPRDTTELREMMFWMSGYQSGPTAVRYPRGSGDDSLPEARTSIAIGKAEVLRTGKHLTLCAIGSMVGPAHQAARELAEDGVEATVINARFAKPIDFETIFADAQKTGNLILIEEGSRIGGFGQQVRDEMVERGLTGIRTQIMAIPDHFVEHGTQAILRRDLGLDAEGIKAKARSLIETGLR